MAKAQRKLRRVFADGGSTDPGPGPAPAPDSVTQEVVDWNQQYINSPKYKERLANFYKYPEAVQRARGTRMQETVFNKPDARATALSYYPRDNTITLSDSGLGMIYGQFGPNVNKNLAKQEVTAHELGHGTNSSGYHGSNSPTDANALSLGEQKYLLERNKAISPERRKTIVDSLGTPNRSGVKQGAANLMADFEHDNMPGENSSDLNALRFLLNKKKLYNAGQQDFTPEHLKKARADKDLQKSFIFKRLQNTFDDKELIDIMNKIAMNKQTQQPTIAAHGGRIGKKKTMYDHYATGGNIMGMSQGNFSTAAAGTGQLVDSLDQGNEYGRKKVGTSVASGALSGAAMGASVGGPWGAVIGGVVGAGVGLVTGKKAKKREEQQIATSNAMRDTARRQASSAALANDPTLSAGYSNGSMYAAGGQLNSWYTDPQQTGTVATMAEGGGIHIKPENRGKFTAWAENRGMSVSQAANKVMANKEDYSSTIVKRANFAKNFAADGGPIGPGGPVKQATDTAGVAGAQMTGRQIVLPSTTKVVDAKKLPEYEQMRTQNLDSLSKAWGVPASEIATQSRWGYGKSAQSGGVPEVTTYEYHGGQPDVRRMIDYYPNTTRGTDAYIHPQDLQPGANQRYSNPSSRPRGYAHGGRLAARLGKR